MKKTMAKSGMRNTDMVGVRGSEFGSKNPKSEIHNPKSRGVSIIAALFIIMILAFMGLVFLSFISTSSFTSLNDMQSAQALSVAEGGLEYILANRTFPNYSMSGATVNLGAGSFTISTPASLTVDPGAAGTTITVQSTANFPNTGRIIIDSELIDYTGKTATTFSPATRGVGGTTAVAHAVGNAVYPVTAVTDNPLAAGSATINVASNVGFSIPGMIIIDTEHIYCSGVVGTTQFTNCTRGYRGSSATAHPNASNVFQYALTSVGTVGNAQREVVRSARRIPGAMMVYARANGDGTPYYRRWNGSSWGPELTATNVGANIQYLVLKFARTRNEAILGTLSSSGDIRVQVWNGTSWGGALLLANVGTTNDNYRGFDIEYETNGDRAIVVFNDGTADPDYRIWDGMGWTAAANINLPTTGIPRWIELAPNPLAGSDEIVMISLDDNSDIYGMRWSGAAWVNISAFAAWDNSAATSTTKVIDVAYEQLSGRAMFIWGDNNSDDQQYRIWDGAALTANTLFTIANMGGEARWVRLVSDPASNRLLYGVQDASANPDLNTALWSGPPANSWTIHAEHDGSLEDTADRNFDIVFESHPARAGMAWLAWGNGATLSRRPWDGAAWGAPINTGDDTAMVQLMAHPISGAVFSLFYEDTTSATDDIWETHLTSGGAVWSPRYTSWGGPTVGNPVRERLFMAAERYNPMIAPDWREINR
jgi:hypothetical protein